MQESLFSINKFEEPKVLENQNAICQLIMRLLLLNKGDMELHPEMGVGLIQNYRYMFTDDLDDLQLEIEKQISTYITKTSDVKVDLQIEDQNLYISIKIAENLFVFKFDTQNNTIKLSDL